MQIEKFCNYLEYERNYSKLTIKSYKDDLTAFAKFAWGEEQDISEADDSLITEKLLRRWMASMLEGGNSATTVNRRLSAMRSYFKYLLASGLSSVDPTLRVKGPKTEKPLPYFMKEAEMNRLLDDIPVKPTFEGVRNHFIVEMFYDTGMRLSELTQLNIDDIDFSARQVKVTGKRNKQRIIPMAPRLLDSVKRYLDARRNVTPAEHGALIVDKHGARLKDSEVRIIVQNELSMVTTMKKKSPHVLRHSFATAMLNHGADIEAVRRLLGHESLATTEIYTHTTFEQLKKEYQHAHPRA